MVTMLTSACGRSIGPGVPLAAARQATATLLLLSSLLASRVSPAEATPPMTGGGGFARYFRGQKNVADVASVRIPLPSPEATIELWVRLDDASSRTAHALLSYSAVETPPDTNTVKDKANALALMAFPGELTMVHYFGGLGQVFRCQSNLGSPQCSSRLFEGWTHLALAINTTEGNVKLYLNGTKAMDLLHDNTTVTPEQDVQALRLPPPQEGGLLTFGQDPNTYQGSYAKHTQLNGLIDQVRVWASERTEAEIKTWMHRTKLPEDDNLTLLRADFRMDSTSEEEGIFEPDMSSGTNDLAVGAIHQGIQTIEYVDGTAQHPMVPPVVVSTADLWDGPIGAAVGPSGSVSITLKAHETDSRPMILTITRLPEFGDLSQLLGADEVPIRFGDSVTNEGLEVLFTVSNSSEFSGDSFEYTAINDLGESSSAQVVLIPDERKLLTYGDDLTLEATEGSVHFFQLGGFSRCGEPFRVAITEMPQHGELYQVEFQDMPVQGDIVEIVSTAGSPIIAVPQEVTARSGMVAFAAPPNLGSRTSITDHIFVSLSGGLGYTETIVKFTVAISAANDFPVASSLEVTAAADEVTVIELQATDEEGDAIFFEVQKLPGDGAMLHRSDGIQVTSSVQPVVSQHPSHIPQYSPDWGPSWTSQVSLCACCYTQATCNVAGGIATTAQCPCPADTYGAAQTLGPPDVYPTPGVSQHSWTPLSGFQYQFLVVAVDIPVYITEVRLYEIHSPGAVVRISAAASYSGNTTDWAELYSGPVERLAAESVRIFSPTLCPSPGTAAAFLRIDLNLAPGVLYALDAIEVLGTLTAPGQMLLQDRRVMYQPPIGFHGGQQHLTYTARDCKGSTGVSHSVNITVLPPTDLMKATSFGPAVQVDAQIGVGTRVEIPLESLWQILPSHLQGRAPGAFSVGSVGELPEGVLILSEGGQKVRLWSTTETMEDNLLLPSPSPVFHVADQRSDQERSAEPLSLQAWLHYKDSGNQTVTYRVGLQVNWQCPPGDDPKACALSFTDCGRSTDFFDESWESGALKCISTPRVGKIAGVVVAAVLILAGALLAILLLLQSRRRTKVLASELQALKVAHGESDDGIPMLLDVDTPLSKVAEFLAELSDLPPAKGVFSKKKNRAEDIQARARTLRQVLSQSQGVFTPSFGVVPDAVSTFEDKAILDDNANYMLQFTGQRSTVRRRRPSANTTMHFSDECLTDADSPAVLLKVADLCRQPPMDTLGNTLFFDIFRVSTLPESTPLTMVAIKGLEVLGLNFLLGKGTHVDKFATFVMEIEKRYLNVQYHCALHAADVTARLIGLLKLSGISSGPEPLKHSSDHAVLMLSAVLAAVVHDVGHTGQNNAYHCATMSEEAEQSHDLSVLEFNSLSIAFDLLKRDETNFLMGWSTARKSILRKAVIDMVLGTDFSRHFQHIESFKTQVLSNASQTSYHALDHDKQLLTLKLALKVADIGHCAAEFSAHVKWCQLLEEEFFLQGDLEKQADLVVGPLMDREKAGAASPVSLMSFFEALALPLFRVWVDAFPESVALLDQAKSNLSVWAAEMN